MKLLREYIRGLLLEQVSEFLYRSSPEEFVQNLLRDGSIRSHGQDFVSISLDPASGGKDNYGEVTMKLDREKIFSAGGLEVVYDDPDFWNQFPAVAKHVTGYAGEDDYIDRGGDEEWGMDFPDMAMDFEEEQEIVIPELPLDAVVSVSSTVPLSQETLDLLSKNGIPVTS